MIMKTKNKDKTPKFVALAVICLVVGISIGLVSYHYLFKPQSAVYEGLTQGNTSTNWQSTKVESTKEMVEEIVLLGNGKKEPIDPKSEEGTGIASLLTRKLHELNLQSTCVFSKEDIQEIEQKDRSIRLFFKKPIDITISQWVEPEERYHISTDINGYRILENVGTALFIIEDNLDEGLEAHVLIDHKIKGRIGYSCWAIKKEGSQEIEKNWIEELNKILISEEFCGWSTYAKCKTDVDCNMGGCSGEVCEGKGEGTITDCQARDCYYVAGYECKCVNDKCQWSSIVEKISMWQNGEELISYPRKPSSKYNLRVNNIIKTLHKIDLQATCVFSEEDIQEIKQKDRVVEIVFKNPRDITINQWVQPENYIEGYHLPVNRILRNVKTALFILEDNLDEGLEAHILVGKLIPPKMGSGHDEEWISYSCWAIQQEGSNELDKSWINEIRFKGG